MAGEVPRMDIDGGERGNRRQSMVWVCRELLRDNHCSSTVTAELCNGWFYSPALLTFELEVHIYCCFHFAEDVQAQIRARLSQPDSQFLADDL